MKKLFLISVLFLSTMLTYAQSIPIIAYNDVQLEQQTKNPLSVSVYPNPFSDVIRVSSDFENLNFRIVDVHGKEILSGNASNIISGKSLKAGLYFIYLYKDEKIIYDQRMIKL